MTGTLLKRTQICEPGTDPARDHESSQQCVSLSAFADCGRALPTCRLLHAATNIACRPSVTVLCIVSLRAEGQVVVKALDYQLYMEAKLSMQKKLAIHIPCWPCRLVPVPCQRHAL